MTASTVRSSTIMNANAVRAIATGAVAAGLLDATFSIVLDVVILRAFSLVGLLQWIASGAIGAAAFSGGLATAALGLAIHFVLAAIFAGFYYLVSRRIAALRTQAIPIGIVYGAAIWMSAVPKAAFDPVVFTAFLLDHAFLVGLPIALAVKRYAP
jgi:hypothetical protein